MRPGFIGRVRRGLRLTSRAPSLDYQALYEAHARSHVGADAIGDGDFDTIGSGELAILRECGLRPDSALLDFGCGVGRLAKFAVPFLAAGSYTGVDIAPTMIKRAEASLGAAPRSCRVRWAVQGGPRFDFPAASFDMICAFSVFTHLEHEDAYRYLLDAVRVIRPVGCFVLTCLPIQSTWGRRAFLDSARLSLNDRWREVRNVATTLDFMVAIAALAGWHALPHQAVDEGQTVLVLKPS
jgi:SAM-dependent methyltransferase